MLLVVSGMFRSIGFTASNSVAFVDVDPERMTAADTLMSTLRELGARLGVGALLVRLGQPITGAWGPAGPFRVAFVALAVILLIPAIEGTLLPRTAGSAVTGRA